MNEVILIVGHPRMDAETIGKFVKAAAKACGMEAVMLDTPFPQKGGATSPTLVKPFTVPEEWMGRNVSGDEFMAAVRESGGGVWLDEAKTLGLERLKAHLEHERYQTGHMGEYGTPFPLSQRNDCYASSFYDSGSYTPDPKKAHTQALNKLRGANRHGFRKR